MCQEGPWDRKLLGEAVQRMHGGILSDVCPTSKEDIVLSVAGEVGARDGHGIDRTVQDSAFKAEATGGYGGVLSTMGHVESAW